MARGRPALLGLVAGGIFMYAGYRINNGTDPIPPEIGKAVIGIGALVFILGLIVQFRAPDRPNLRQDEQILYEWNPAQSPSITLIISGSALCAAGGGLLYLTTTPYIYGIIIGAIGLFVFVSGSTRYYKNSLTTYFLTTQNAIYEYRLFQKNEKKVHLDQINGSQRTDTRIERFVNAGSITLKAPDNHVTFRSVSSPRKVLEQIEEKYR